MLLATTLQSHTEAMPGLPSLGEKRWAHPLPLATIPPGAWHRYTPPCLYALWHPSHGLICHSLILAPSTGLARGRQFSGPGQHLSPLPFSHLNGVLSIVRDINNDPLLIVIADGTIKQTHGALSEILRTLIVNIDYQVSLRNFHEWIFYMLNEYIFDKEYQGQMANC